MASPHAGIESFNSMNMKMNIQSQPDQQPGFKIGNPWVTRELIAVTIGVAVLAAFALIIDPYFAYVATSWIIFGITGLSLDLVWGRAGVLSLSQTAFYGLGGYAGSIVEINFSHLTGNTLIWSLPVGFIIGAIIAAAISLVIFYGRMGVLQTTILTSLKQLRLLAVSVVANNRFWRWHARLQPSQES